MKLISGLFVLCFSLASLPALAQDAQGNDTPGNWVVDHFERYGIWVSSCDWRNLEGKREERCYLRYVDVYSPRPEFGAAFLFVFQKNRKTTFQYANERGTVYLNKGLGISRNATRSYYLPEICRTTPGCILENPKQVADLLAAFSKGGTLVQTFTGKYGKPHQLKWSLNGFKEALADYEKQSQKRNLLD